MPQFMLRFDMRRPGFAGAGSAELYRAAIEMCAWGEERGFSAAHISEHHGSPDGYLPAPLLLASAIAARTEKLLIYVSALIAPLHNEVRLAEQLAVLDIISEGRVMTVLGAGYREEECAAIGKSLKDRGPYMDMIAPFLERAWQGEPFRHEGREVLVTPRPHSRPRPPLLIGGSTRAAARRAARHGDYFIPTDPAVFQHYRDELAKLGKPDPGETPPFPAAVLFAAVDPDAYWAEIGPHLQHDTNTYAAWAAAGGLVKQPYAHCDTLEEVRARPNYLVFTPEELIAYCRKLGDDESVIFHPLCGGIHPDLAWQSLRLVADKVIPALR